ncbi:DUF866 domain-containing protein [Histoplasma capsulatum var. duboisii H88]|uniref:DUF866 domain-containing protein n=1 Tax=Ajellomyces capsulatus (strain H88) TaxID=544711 RepID=A0A8A1LPG0_AJEC8|nr:DUF866 domain-containing protein [Histoplasma capsulatum var. duboisii H88]
MKNRTARAKRSLSSIVEGSSSQSLRLMESGKQREQNRRRCFQVSILAMASGMITMRRRVKRLVSKMSVGKFAEHE